VLVAIPSASLTKRGRSLKLTTAARTGATSLANKIRFKPSRLRLTPPPRTRLVLKVAIDSSVRTPAFAHRQILNSISDK
jgi:hypothetical protein